MLSSPRLQTSTAHNNRHPFLPVLELLVYSSKSLPTVFVSLNRSSFTASTPPISRSTTASTMSSSYASCKSHNELLARRKALHTHVYISGLSGHHTLEVGIAYYYRGHYIYAYPAGNLIEPIPYSTRKGIMIQGIVSESAPGYDKDAEGLREEEEIRALEKSVEGERKAREEVKEEKVMEITGVVEALTTSQLRFADVKNVSAEEPLKTSSRPDSPALRLTPPAEDLQRSITSLALLRDVGLNTSTPRHGLSFLATSAPGSRLASRSASPSELRPTSSHVGLARLGAIRGPTSPLGDDYFEANSSIEDVPSRPASGMGYLYGLGDHALSAENLPRPVEVTVKPCAIHGEECDGASVEGTWLTEQTRRGLGLVEEVPMVERGGRHMVDWAGLLEETKAESTE